MLKWLLTLLRGVPAAALPQRKLVGERGPEFEVTPRILPKPAPTGLIALVVGHNPKAQGAIRTTDRRTEYDWNGALAERICAAAFGPDKGITCRVRLREGYCGNCAPTRQLRPRRRRLG